MPVEQTPGAPEPGAVRVSLRKPGGQRIRTGLRSGRNYWWINSLSALLRGETPDSGSGTGVVPDAVSPFRIAHGVTLGNPGSNPAPNPVARAGAP